MSDEYTLEQELTLLEQDYALLHEILDDLRQKARVETDYEKKYLIQSQIEDYKKELLETKHRLEQLKKEAKLGDKRSVLPGKLYNVPELPLHFTEQPLLFKQLKTKLASNPDVVEAAQGQKTPLLLQGVSGVGKSVFATALAHDPEVRRAFVSGIFWVHLGQEADLVARHNEIIHILGFPAVHFIETEKSTLYLQSICSTRACLFILDDIWDVRDVLAFNELGKHVQLLMTTSDTNILDYIKHFLPSTRNHTIEPFEEETAINFLAQCAKQSVTALPMETRGIIRACRYLPLTLKLIANLAQSPNDWSIILKQLQNPNCKEFPETVPCPIMQTLHINVEALGEEGIEYYLTLAVFVDYTHIPQAAVVILWRYLYHHSEEQAYGFIQELTKRGLLKSQGDYVTLHTFQHDYLCHYAELEKLHDHLLAAYRRCCGNHGWADGPQDGYFFQHLNTHLYTAGRHRELKMLLLDFDWLQASLRANTLHILLHDYQLLDDDQELTLVKKALRDAIPVLLQDKTQLASRLLNYLWNKPSPGIQKLLNQAKEMSPDWVPPR
ncbi:MAG: hypothetical protein BWK79_18760 [Beggiatoa sp. IS2]|nr:MAG: hypothetical protein BWK79_18760 [Beggiatoa sp. IS2]